MTGIKNLLNIDPKFLRTPYDPDQQFSVPYLWGTTGIGYNKKLVSKQPTSWWDLWDEKYKGRICMLDSPGACISAALLLKGHPETTSDAQHIQEAKELLLKQKPLVKQYSSASYVDMLASGEAALAMAYSGDVLQAVKEHPHLDYVLPKEGGYIWLDCLCLLSAAPHSEDAARLIDYLLRPKVAAGIANAVRYATPNAAARPWLDANLLADKRIYPPPAAARLLHYHSPLDSEAYVLWNQTWAEVKG
jgi:spermidine/putrescine-binding protein